MFNILYYVNQGCLTCGPAHHILRPTRGITNIDHSNVDVVFHHFSNPNAIKINSKSYLFVIISLNNNIEFEERLAKFLDKEKFEFLLCHSF